MAIEAVFKRPFSEQIAFFRGKLGNLIPTERWTDVWKSAHDTGFMVAGAAKADLLSDLARSVDEAISQGTGIDVFRKQFAEIVEKHGWSYRGEFNWRTRTIYRTNMTTSYAAGRLVQLKDGGFPFWMYRHSDSVARPRPLHVSWDKLTLPANHPWWQTHYPPNGWGCQCYVIGVSRKTAERLGGRITDPPDDGTSPDGTPNGIDKGWDYQPGATANLVSGIGEKAGTMPAALAGAMLASVAADDAFVNWFSDPVGGWPLARIPDIDMAAIGAKRGVAELSSETAVKQKKAHPELVAADYAQAQAVIDNHTNKVTDGPRAIIYIREIDDAETGGHVIVVKATQSGNGLWVSSFRRLSRDDAERDREVRRLLRKGTR